MKNEVFSLVSDECANLISFSESLVMDIGQIAVIGSLPLPDISKLKPGWYFYAIYNISLSYLSVTLPSKYVSFESTTREVILF